MLLRPKKTKQFKVKKDRLHSLNYNSKILTKGFYGLKALDYARLTSKQIQTIYMAINKMLPKPEKVYSNIFPNTPVTSKNIDSRMGKGKGEMKHWVCSVRPGKILFEISNVTEDIAYSALTYGASKICIQTKIITIKKFQ